MDANIIIAVGAAIGTAVTAVATIMLWRITGILAKETARMAEGTNRPKIAAAISTNRWTMLYADLVIHNTGNATAFDIHVDFSPPLMIEDDIDSPIPAPFSRISILRPNEILSCYIGQSEALLEKSYTVTTSWQREPNSQHRETLSYILAFGHMRDVGQLGASSPFVQIANEVKHIRDDWRAVAQGNRKLRADVYTSVDRSLERKERERQLKSR